MRIQDAIEMLNRMQSEGVYDEYAIGGAVGATFYLDPIATVDLDVFVKLRAAPGRLIVDPQPIFKYLKDHGCVMEAEYVLIADWPVQFLAPAGSLGDEALEQAETKDVDGTPVRVFTAEHLAAICLETGRAKDKARLLQFVESGAIDVARFEDIVSRHGLASSWADFKMRFLEATQ